MTLRDQAQQLVPQRQLRVEAILLVANRVDEAVVERPRGESVLHQWQKHWVSNQVGPHEFSCVMALLEGKVRKRVLGLSAAINDESLTEKGREDQPHVTVFYGLHTDNATKVRDLVETFGPVKARLGKIDHFAADEHDVVIVRVESEDLHLLHEELGQLPNTDKYSEYQPHITVAYVKPGMGQKWVDQLEGETFDEQGVEAEEIDVEFTQLVFSPANGTPTAIDVASYAAQEAGALKRVVSVNVEAPNVDIRPQVNVEAPQVHHQSHTNVSAPNVQVSAPAVNVEAPQVQSVVQVDMTPVAQALDRLSELVTRVMQTSRPAIQFKPRIIVPGAPDVPVVVEEPQPPPVRKLRTLTIRHSDGTESTVVET